MDTEIIIEASPRGYRFSLPEWCAPCPNAVFGFRQLIKGYDRDKQVRSFPAEKLADVLEFLNYWYVEANTAIGDSYNRNGGKRCSVRVAEAAELQEAA